MELNQFLLSRLIIDIIILYFDNPNNINLQNISNNENNTNNNENYSQEIFNYLITEINEILKGNSTNNSTKKTVNNSINNNNNLFTQNNYSQINNSTQINSSQNIRSNNSNNNRNNNSNNNRSNHQIDDHLRVQVIFNLLDSLQNWLTIYSSLNRKQSIAGLKTYPIKQYLIVHDN